MLRKIRGQFAPKSGGQFAAEKRGHFQRFFHPTTEARWNFKYIQAFQNPRPVKTKNCSAPRYMYVDAVYEIPDFYWKDKNGNTVEPYMDCPNAIGPLSMTNNLCYKTVTLLVEITEYTANAGLSVAKVMPCPNCSKLCNKPFNREVLVPDEDCEEETKREAMYNALLQYRQHIEQMAAEFDKEYADRCFIPDNETFELEYKLWQYHYTLYYFDQAGQLIKTVPPAGVDIDNENLSQAQRQALVEDRAVTAKLHRENNTNPRAKTYHSLITNYRYNTLGLPAWQYTPDGGVSHTWYDALARPTFSQNSKQVLTDKYSYIKYDNLGRPVETGETEFGPSFMLYKHDFSSATVYNNVVSEKEVGPISFYKIGLDATIDVHESSNNRFLRIRPANNTINETNTETNLTLESGKTYTVLFDVAFNGNTNLDCIITSYSTLTNPPSSVVLLNSTAIGSGLFTSNITVPVNSTEVKLVFTGHHNSSNSPDDVLLIDDFQISTTSLPAHKPTSRNLATSGYIASFIASGQHKEVTKTSFDIPFNSARANTAFPEGIKNTRNRPISQCYEEIEDNKKETYDVATIMSYDIHGNVIKAVKDVPVLTHITDGYFTIESQYDLLTGKTNSVTYQKGKRDQWIHKYYYDADNRLVSIYTSRDAINWENDAKYFYSLSGNLARTELGELKVQGLDYAATVNGWIKGVNGGSLTPDQDIGLDGYVSTTNTNRYVGRDAFGYILSYFNNDYVNISGEHVDADRTGSDLQGKTNGRELFNGNIMQMQVALPKNRGANSWAGNNTAGPPSRVITPEVLGNVYHYDQLNRITKHYAFDEFAAPSTTSPYLGGTWLNSGKTGTDKYYETFAFDPNGNITALNRNSGTIVSGATDYKMDEMTYEYDKVSVTITLQQNTSISYTLLNLQSNKLYKVNDNVNASFYDNDIDAQGAGNYVYDNLGNLIEDKAEHIQEITWNNAGKIKKVIRKNTTAKADLEFGYDEGGQRLWKLVIPKEEVSPSTSPKTYKYKQQEFWDTTWYLGSARYSMQHLRKVNGFDTLFKQWTLDELDIVGQSRHGLYKPSEVIGLRNIKLDPITGYDENGRFITAEGGLGIYWNSSKFELSRDNKICILVRGNKQYELSNHLGNVLVTVSDRKGSRQLAGTTGNNADYYLPYILTITDYYAFGSTITERSASFGESYRYGFNNQEQDGELGDYYAFEYRIHDARLGRFLSVDPLAPEYPWNSCYAFAENRIIDGIDLEGLEYVRADGKSTNNSRISQPVYSEGQTELANGLTIYVEPGRLLSYIDNVTGDRISAMYTPSGTFHHYGSLGKPSSQVKKKGTSKTSETPKETPKENISEPLKPIGLKIVEAKADEIPVTNKITLENLKARSSSNSGMERFLSGAIKGYQSGNYMSQNSTIDKYDYCWSMEENKKLASAELAILTSFMPGGGAVVGIGKNFLTKGIGSMVGNAVGQTIVNTANHGDLRSGIMDLNVPSVLTAAIPAGKIFSFKSMAINGTGSINIKLSSFSSSEQFNTDLLNKQATFLNLASGFVGSSVQNGLTSLKNHKYDFNISPPTNFQSNLYNGLTNFSGATVGSVANIIQ